MNRLRARTGSWIAGLLIAAALVAAATAVRAEDRPLWFAGTRLIFERSDNVNGELAVAVRDGGLAKFLGKIGASIAWQPGERYIIVTASDRRVIRLTLGDAVIDAAGIASRAPFAPYTDAGDAFIPFFSVARALYVEPVPAADATVLEPQLAALSVRKDGKRTVVTLRGPGVLRFRRALDTAERLDVVFPGLGSALGPSRILEGMPALEKIDVATAGSAKNPVTTVSFSAAAGSVHQLLASDTPSELIVAFAPAGVALDAPADAGTAKTVLRGPRPAVPLPAGPATPTYVPPLPPPPGSGAPSASPQAAATSTGVSTLANVTAVDAEPIDDGATVRIRVTGTGSYEWHRLADQRFYLDLKNAHLTIPVRDDQVGTPAVQTLRFRQLTPETVRVTLGLGGDKHVEVVAGDGFLNLVVNGADETSGPKVGAGALGLPATAYKPAIGPSASSDWKFSPPPGARVAGLNSRLIVLDPGHGGSDPGAQNAALGLTEKALNLDISLRLRTLLAAQGWIVRLTRESDTDVYGPNASDKEELQARCDVANNAGARMFVSIHINSFTSNSLNGATTYYYKPADLALANAIHARLTGLELKDDGVRKNNFYVIHHTTMPAALIETAFLSNPADAALLRSPGFLQRVAQAIADGIKDYSGGADSAPAQTSMDK